MAISIFTQKRSAYSLPELIVSMAIFGILASIVLANFHRAGLSGDLRISSQELAGNVRRVQNLATVGQAIGTDAGNLVPPGGYGIAFRITAASAQYIMFADFTDAFGAPPVCELTNPSNADSEYDEGPGCDTMIESGAVLLKRNVRINKIDLPNDGLGCLDPSSTVDITFKPPKPVPIIDGQVGKTVLVELEHTQTNETRVLTIIGASGQISENIGSLSCT